MNWHYQVFGCYDKAIMIAHREAAHRRCHFSVVVDRYGNYSVWPGVLGENEACYVAVHTLAYRQTVTPSCAAHITEMRQS